MNDQAQSETVFYKIKTHSNMAMQLKRKEQSFRQNGIQRLQSDFRYDKVIESNPLLSLLAKAHNRLHQGQLIYNFIKDYPFFRNFFSKSKKIKYDLDKAYDICTKLQLEVFRKGQAIMREGQVSNDKMYLVVVGDVIVTQKKHEDLALLRKQKSIQAYIPDDLMDLIEKTNQIVVNEYGPGGYFGERALMQAKKQAIRSATCIAASDAYLMSLLKEDIIDLLECIQEDFMAKKLLFDRVFPKFDELKSALAIEDIMYSFREENRRRDEKVIREGDQTNHIFILVEGELAIMKEYNGHQLMLCMIHNNELFGEECFKNEAYNYSVIVTSNEAKILKASANIIMQRSPWQCVKAIEQLFLKRQEHRSSQLQTIIKQNQHASKLKRLYHLDIQKKPAIKDYYMSSDYLDTKLGGKSTIDQQNSIFQMDSLSSMRRIQSPVIRSDRSCISINHLTPIQQLKKDLLNRKKKFIFRQIKMNTQIEKLLNLRSFSTLNHEQI